MPLFRRIEPPNGSAFGEGPALVDHWKAPPRTLLFPSLKDRSCKPSALEGSRISKHHC